MKKISYSLVFNRKKKLNKKGMALVQVGKELTGARTSSGVCGLIRSNAKNLTRA